MPKIKSEPPQEEDPQVVNLSGSRVEQINAELVRVEQSMVGDITNADEVDLHISSAMHVTARNVSAHNSLVGMAQADQVTLNESAAFALRARQATINGNAGAVLVEESASLSTGARAGVLAARNVQAEQVRTVVLLAGKVEGPVETMLDSRRVVLASLVAGLVTGSMLLLGQFLFRRKK